MSTRLLRIGFAALLLAVAAVLFFRGDGDDAPPGSTLRAQPAVPEPPLPGPRARPAVLESPSNVRRDSVAKPVPSRLSGSSAISASAPTSSSGDESSPIPTELPDSPSLEKELSRNGTVPDYRVVYTYQLGLMAFYQNCMRGRISRGVIYYYIKWQVDEETHLASSPFFDRADVPSEGDVTSEDELAFAACVKEYLATHDRVDLPHGGPNGEAWGMRAVFPLRDSPLLKMIAKARVEDRSVAPSR